MEIYEQGKTERNLGLALYCLLTMFCSYKKVSLEGLTCNFWSG